MRYRTEIDGLRAVAVIPVILFHAGFESFSGGFVGVDVFFVISGYLITSILIEEIFTRKFSITRFYERRTRRILPALYVVVLTTLILSYFLLYPEYLVSLGKSAISVPVFLANFFFWSERGYFGDSTSFKPLVHTWSLAVEEQFYLVFPLFILLLSRNRRLLYSALVIVFFLSLSASYYVTLLHFESAFYFPFTRAWELLVGSFCALLLRENSISTKHSDFLALVGCSLIAYAITNFDENTLFPHLNALLPVIGSALFIVFATGSSLTAKIMSRRGFVYLGLISFSLYLWHQPLFAIARHVGIFEQRKLELMLVTLALSVLTFHYIERPFRNSAIISSGAIVKFSLFGGLAIICLGLIYAQQLGFPGRYGESDRAILTQLASYKGYNQRRFDESQLKPFSHPDSYRVALIGDSYAKDFLNVVIESGKFVGFEFSTRQVNSECGNLLLDSYAGIQKFIPKHRRKRCSALGRYDGEAFTEILGDADEIWLVSSWQTWVVSLLPKSIENLTEEYSKTVRIFGIKSFGAVVLKDILSIPREERPPFTQPVSPYSQSITESLAKSIGSYEYYHEVGDALCGGSSDHCRIFTDGGLLMSTDGEHLTKEGAIEGSYRLENVLTEVIDSSRRQ